MKFYIASGFENAQMVKSLALILKAYGMSHTYDWTTEGSVKGTDNEVTMELAENELNGVKEADVVIVLLPGGGVHTQNWECPMLSERKYSYGQSQRHLFC